MRLLSIVFILFLSGCRFYEVDAGKLYRSPQPSAEELESYINDYGIKTVINLRGENPAQKWWQDEKKVVEKYGIRFVNIGMSAKKLPHKENLKLLLDELRSAPKPILVHCKAGVDRTGEASALYQMIYMGKSKAEALEMLSSQFAHFEQFMPAKLYFVRDLWVDESWALNDYSPCDANYKFYDKNSEHCGTQEPVESTPVLDLDSDT